MEIVNMNEFKRQQKRLELKQKIENACKKVQVFYHNNRELCLVAIPAAIGGLGFGAKSIIKRSNLKKQENIKNLYCYDRSLGHYWRLRRELTNSEWVEIDKRKRKGERLADILAEFKVLK